MSLRRFCLQLRTALAVALALAFFATVSFAQKSGKGRYINIPLTRDAKQNGYKIYQRGRYEINFTATGVIDPATDDKLRGITLRPRERRPRCKN